MRVPLLRPRCALRTLALIASLLAISARPSVSASGRTLPATPPSGPAALAAPGYCSSTGGSTAYESITNVSLTRLPGNALRVQVDVYIANPQGCTAGNPCPSYDPSPENVNVWIDWNGDHVWDASEKVMDQAGSGYLNINYQGTMTFLTTVVIPPTAVGETWLRASLGWGSDPDTPCISSWTWGNVFDRVVRFEKLAVTSISATGAETRMQDVSDPVWQTSFASSPECGVNTPSRQEPLAGGFSGAGPTLHVQLEACPANPAYTPRVDWKWTIPATPGASQQTRSGTFNGLAGDIPLTLPRAVGKTRVDLEFSIYDNFGDLVTADRVKQTASVDVYVGVGAALGLPPKKAWLDKVTTWASGATTTQQAAQKLVAGIYGNGGWLYRDPGLPWQPLIDGTGTNGNCFTMSNLWKASMDMLGAGGSNVAQTRGSTNRGFLTKTSHRQSFDPGQAGNAHPQGGAIDRWMFGMHQVGSLSGTYYDPTFNNVFSPLTSFIQWNMLGVDAATGVYLFEGNVVGLPLASSAPWGEFVYRQMPPLASATTGTQAVTAAWDGAPSFTPVDAGADGHAEALRVSAHVTVTGDAVSQGLYTFWGEIAQGGTFVTRRASVGSMLPSRGNLGPAGVGTYPVSLDFSGEDIRGAATAGPLTARLWLADADGNPLGTLVGDSPSYVPTQFGESPAYVDAMTDFGRDLDADGLFDEVVVRAHVSSGLAMPAYVMASFHMPGSDEAIAQAFVPATLVAGANDVDVALDASLIGLTGSEGPFDVHVTLYDDAGTPLSTRVGTSATYPGSLLEPLPLSFTGSPTDQGVDTDANGLYESLAIDVPVNVAAAGDYTATGVLQLDAQHVVSAAEVLTFGAGPGTLRLRFPGPAIQSSGVNGAYTLTSLIVTDADGTPTAVRTAPYVTHAYAAASFEPPPQPIVSITGPLAAVPVDADADGLTDTLMLDVPVTVSRQGNVVASALLFTNDGRFVEQASAFRPALPGVPIVIHVPFSGRKLYARGESGPFFFQNLYVYQTGDPTNGIERVKALVTPHWPLESFERPPLVNVTVRRGTGTPIPYASVYLSPFSDAGSTDLAGQIRLAVSGAGGASVGVNLQAVPGLDDAAWSVFVNGGLVGTGRSTSVAPAAGEIVNVEFVHASTSAILDASPTARTVRGVTLSDAAPNPATSAHGARVSYRLPERSTGTATLYDLHGRAVGRWDLVADGGRDGVLELGRGAEGRTLAVGLYVLRMDVRKSDGDVVKLERKVTFLR